MDNERLARVEEQVKWIAPRVERIENKLDKLIESHQFFKGKMFGAAMLAALVMNGLIEFLRR